MNGGTVGKVTGVFQVAQNYTKPSAIPIGYSQGLKSLQGCYETLRQLSCLNRLYGTVRTVE